MRKQRIEVDVTIKYRIKARDSAEALRLAKKSECEEMNIIDVEYGTLDVVEDYEWAIALRYLIAEQKPMVLRY